MKKELGTRSPKARARERCWTDGSSMVSTKEDRRLRIGAAINLIGSGCGLRRTFYFRWAILLSCSRYPNCARAICTHVYKYTGAEASWRFHDRLGVGHSQPIWFPCMYRSLPPKVDVIYHEENYSVRARRPHEPRGISAFWPLSKEGRGLGGG